MLIKKAIREDIPQLLELWRGQSDYHYALDQVYYVPYSSDSKDFETYLQKNIVTEETHIYVAKEGEIIVGFVTFEDGKEDYFDTYIRSFGVVIELFVKETFRNQGIGKALLETAEKYFSDKGVKDIKLVSSTFNTHALKFYEKLGYINRQTSLFKKIR